MDFNKPIRGWLHFTFSGLAGCLMLVASCLGQPFDALRVAPLTTPHQDAPAYISAVNDRVVVRGNLVFLADGNAGLRVFSLRDRRDPDLVGAYRTGGFASSVRAVGKRLYVMNTPRGFAAFEMVEPMTLRRLDSSQVNVEDLLRVREKESAARENSPGCVAAIVDGHVYLAREDFGVAVIEMQSGENARRHGAQTAGDEPVAVRPLVFADAPATLPMRGGQGFQGTAMDTVADQIPAPSVAPGTISLHADSVALELTARLEENVVTVRIAGEVGQKVRVQRSSSVADGWLDWETVVLEHGTIELTDEDAAGAGQIFYRAISD